MQLSPERLAALTPTDRNRYVDFLRAASILVVVLGHWLMAVIAWEDGRIAGGHLLAMAPGFRLLTWVFQVMPIFFIVGGFANAASWDSATRRGLSYADWLRARLSRLLAPTVVFVAVWTAGAVAARLAGIDPELLRIGARLVAVPLWFLAVYALVIPLAPAALRLHRRSPLGTMAALVGGAALVDAASWGLGVPGVGWLNFALVWLAVHQIGFFWRDGDLTRRTGVPLLLALGGLAVLIALVVAGPYPVSMVGVEGTGRTNNAPPSLPLVALGIWQAGLALSLQEAANRWLARPLVWAAVVAVNRLIMTVYLWHLTAMALVALAVYPTGLWPATEALNPAWWALRPVWVATLTLALAVLVALFGRYERAASPPRPAPRGRAGSATALAGAIGVCAGLALLALRGFFVPGMPAGLPLVALAPLALGLVLLSVPGGARRTILEG